MPFFSCETSIPEHKQKISGREVQQQGNVVSIQSNVLDTDGKPIMAYGHCWAPVTSAFISDSITKHYFLQRKKYYTDTLFGLEAYSTYTVRPYLQTEDEISYGNSYQITAIPENFPIAISSVEATGESTVMVQANFSGTGSFHVIATGIEVDSAPYDSPLKLVFNVRPSASWSNQIIGTKALKEFRYRAFVVLNDTCTRYSPPVLFTIYLLDVETIGGIILSPGTVLLEGKINHRGPVPVTEYGFCWSYLTSNPNFNHNRISLGQNPEDGEYQTQLNGLVAGVTYFFRAYGVANGKVYYGATKSFTIPTANLP